jgi:hypothetical protein
MLIVPLSPALFANRLLADWTSHLRCSECLTPLCSCQLSSDLLSVAHLTITSRRQPKTHPFVGTLLCSHTHPTLVYHINFWLLSWTMSNTICMTLQAKEAFLAFTRLESTCAHVARSLARYSIPVKADAIVEKRYPKINLKIMATLIFVPLFLPLRLFDTLLSQKCHNSVLSILSIGTTVPTRVHQ